VAPAKTAAKLAIAIESFERIRAEIAGMGARTPHELMRCAEVTFIRDCAEMAARASLVRAESRWGLYHDRADIPARDDEDWFCHLNLRRGPDGAMEFVKRPVAPYLVPVPEFVPPPATFDALVIDEPARLPRGRSSTVDPTAPVRAPVSEGRLLALLQLAEEQPGLADLEPYLSDADPDVRRTAVTTLTESAPDGAATALARALADAAAAVRAAAVTGLRELADVLPPGTGGRLREHAGSPDPAVRTVVVELLRVTGAGGHDDFATALGDADASVRIQAVHGLVRLDDAAALAPAASDPSREVRITAARSLGAIAAPTSAPTLLRLARDHDPLVRAAALTATAALGCPGPLAAAAITGLRDTAWQVREASALGLAGAAPTIAVRPLLAATGDGNLDVRRAAIRSLAAWVLRPDVAERLRAAVAEDPDADVRAYARQALRSHRPEPD
jgi:HEAT repeat protein